MSADHRITDDLLEKLYPTLGRLSLTWTSMEFSIDTLVTVIYHCFDGKKITPELPFEFRRKLRFLRDCLKIPHASLAQFAAVILKNLDRASNLSQYRHDVVHGYLSRYDAEKKELLFIALDIEPARDFHRTRERKITEDKLIYVATEAGAICSDLLRVAGELVAIAYPGDDSVKNLISK